MSARNKPVAKKHRRVWRQFKKASTQVPAYIDLVQWIKLRRNLTTGECHRLLRAGVLRVDSHKLGYKEVDGVKYPDQFVPAHLNTRITVHQPEKS